MNTIQWGKIKNNCFQYNCIDFLSLFYLTVTCIFALHNLKSKVNSRRGIGWQAYISYEWVGMVGLTPLLLQYKIYLHFYQIISQYFQTQDPNIELKHRIYEKYLSPCLWHCKRHCFYVFFSIEICCGFLHLVIVIIPPFYTQLADSTEI